MPMYEIEQYELWSARWRVEAENKAAAIVALTEGGCTLVADKVFIEFPTAYGMSSADNPDILDGLEALDRADLTDGDLITGVREIEEIDEEQT